MLTVINTFLRAKEIHQRRAADLYGMIILVAVPAYGRETRLPERI